MSSLPLICLPLADCGYRKKAVAEGAVAWSIEQLCLSRAVRATYGICVDILYDCINTEHRRRHPYLALNGDMRITGAFSTLVHAVGPQLNVYLS